MAQWSILDLIVLTDTLLLDLEFLLSYELPERSNSPLGLDHQCPPAFELGFFLFQQFADCGVI